MNIISSSIITITYHLYHYHHCCYASQPTAVGPRPGRPCHAVLYTCACMYECMYVCMYVCMYGMYVCMYVWYVCVCMYVCM